MERLSSSLLITDITTHTSILRSVCCLVPVFAFEQLHLFCLLFEWCLLLLFLFCLAGVCVLFVCVLFDCDSAWSSVHVTCVCVWLFLVVLWDKSNPVPPTVTTTKEKKQTKKQNKTIKLPMQRKSERMKKEQKHKKIKKQSNQNAKHKIQNQIKKKKQEERDNNKDNKESNFGFFEISSQGVYSRLFQTLCQMRRSMLGTWKSHDPFSNFVKACLTLIDSILAHWSHHLLIESWVCESLISWSCLLRDWYSFLCCCFFGQFFLCFVFIFCNDRSHLEEMLDVVLDIAWEERHLALRSISKLVIHTTCRQTDTKHSHTTESLANRAVVVSDQLQKST